MKKLGLAFILVLVLSPVLLLADASIEVPPGSTLEAFLTLIQNVKVWGPLGIGIGAIVVIVRGLKEFIGDFNYKRHLIVVLGIVWGLLNAIQSGLNFFQALIMVLFTSGGAVALYELAVKPVEKKLSK